MTEPDDCKSRQDAQEIERLRAVLSWITGACVDEVPHAEISAAVDRALETEERDG